MYNIQIYVHFPVMFSYTICPAVCLSPNCCATLHISNFFSSPLSALSCLQHTAEETNAHVLCLAGFNSELFTVYMTRRRRKRKNSSSFGATELRGKKNIEIFSKRIFVSDVWLTVHRDSVWIRKTNQMSLFVFFISLLIVAQHVSGNHVPIIRS